MEESLVMEEMVDEQKNKFITFRLGEQAYAFEIRFVGEIIGIQKITPIPDVPDYVRGVFNLRGRVIPAVDVRARLMLAERPYDDRTCIIVARVRNEMVGLIVDTVDEVLQILPEEIEPPPSLKKAQKTQYMQGLAKKAQEVIILLNVEMFLFGTKEEQSN
jgi:purine-binding chemotaxis protein CheW